MKTLKAALMLVVAKLVVSAFTITYKLADNDGMPTAVLITYRYLFGSTLMFPIAYFLERNKRPKMTWSIFFEAFLCATFGGPLSQNMYSKSLILTSATFTAAFSNLIPAVTCIIAILLRLEKVEIGTTTGKAKIVGTLVGIGGAMILTFYKGHQLNIKSPAHFNLLHNGQHMKEQEAHKGSNHIIGSILALGYSFSIALFYTLQGKFVVKYPCHYTNAFMLSAIGFVQSLLYVIPTERHWSHWQLNSPIRRFSAIFQGICSLLAVVLVMFAVRLQGPLFVSVFNPLVLIFVAIASFILLKEKLYVGSLIGSAVVIVGLYLVLWGKGKESKRLSKLTPSGSLKDLDAASIVIATTAPETVSMAPTSVSVNVDEGDELPANYPSENKHEKQEIGEESLKA